ncbi:MAG: hypothetical protein KF845_04340 [Cyclobacteriaceae bacterium]|nr:hypothetical protein [Cyclobacteriaceae bacterium]
MVTLDDRFGFGKYKGLTIKDVWTGPILNYKDIIREYFIGLDKFIKTDFEQSTSFIIPHDYPPLAELLRERPTKVEPFGGFDLVVSKNYLIIDADDLKTTKRVNIELKKIYKDRFDIVPINKLTKGDKGKNTLTSESLKITADPYYILWCIREVGRFSIDLEEFDKLKSLQSNILERIVLKDIRMDLFEYEAKYKLTQIDINQEVEGINSRKIESINNIMSNGRYDREDRERRTFGEYSGSYAQDVMGYSDEDINDIFDGDPDAYWNID